VCVRPMFACVCVEAGTANETEPKIASREQEQRTQTMPQWSESP